MKTGSVLTLHNHPLISGQDRSEDSLVELALAEVETFAKRAYEFNDEGVPEEDRLSIDAACDGLTRSLNAYRRDKKDHQYFRDYSESLTRKVVDANALLLRADDRRRAAKLEKTKADLKEARSDRADEAVEIAKGYFSRQASFNLNEALMWASLALGFGLYAVRMIHEEVSGAPLPTPRWTSVMLIHEVGPRLLVVSLLSYLSVWCGGNSRAANHNRTLNLQRQAALDAFPLFRKSAQGEVDLFREVVLKAMEPLYSRQQTGYADGEQPKADPKETVSLSTLKSWMKHRDD